MAHLIHISLAPNTERDDAILAFKLLCAPWQLIRGPAPTQLETQMRGLLNVRHAHSFSSGRAALWALLKALGIGPGDDILIQAFTCVAVAGPILWLGARPVYVDIDPATFNFDFEDLKRKVTARSRVVIIQHTFGMPANIDSFVAWARSKKIVVIEDCAHALGATYQDRLVGTFGDAAFFSFGRDKVISSVFGGMAVTSDAQLATRLTKIHDALELPSHHWVLQQLVHPVLVTSAVLPTYNLKSAGKALLVAAQHFGLISRVTTKAEKHGQTPTHVAWQMPNALAYLALKQLKKLERFNTHRRRLAKLYRKLLRDTPRVDLPKETPDARNIHLRFTVRVTDGPALRKHAKSSGMVLGDWYDSVVAPADVDLAAVHYLAGSCPDAEAATKQVVNLPTHINTTTDDARRVVELVKKYA